MFKWVSLATQIRLEKAAQRQRKPNYKYLSEEQKKIVKLWERKEQYNKDLDRFWRIAPRNENGAVAWDKLDSIERENFDYTIKKLERTNKSLGKYTNEKIDEAVDAFIKTNLHGTMTW